MLIFALLFILAILNLKQQRDKSSLDMNNAFNSLSDKNGLNYITEY